MAVTRVLRYSLGLVRTMALMLSATFQEGDPEWSRTKDPWDNSDLCTIKMKWQVRKVMIIFWCCKVTDPYLESTSRCPRQCNTGCRADIGNKRANEQPIKTL